MWRRFSSFFTMSFFFDASSFIDFSSSSWRSFSCSTVKRWSDPWITEELRNVPVKALTRLAQLPSRCASGHPRGSRSLGAFDGVDARLFAVLDDLLVDVIFDSNCFFRVVYAGMFSAYHASASSSSPSSKSHRLTVRASSAACQIAVSCRGRWLRPQLDLLLLFQPATRKSSVSRRT